MEKQRLSEISFYNAALCMLVIFIHVSSAPVTGLLKDSAQFALVYIPWRLAAFCMQGFVFLAGLRTFLSARGNLHYKSFYLSRFIRILLPYLIFNVIYYIYFTALGYFPFSVTALLRYIITGTLVSPFYFIVVIVQFYLLTPLWSTLLARTNPLPALVFAALLTALCKDMLPELIRFTTDIEFIYNDRVFTSYLFYWLAGAYAGRSYDGFKQLIKNSRISLAAVTAVFGAANAVFSYLASSRGIYTGFLEQIHYIYCISAVLFLYCVSLALYEGRDLKNRVIRGIDVSSYYIFLVHCLVIYIINGLMARTGVNGIGTQYIIRIAAVYPISAGVSILITRCTARIKRVKRRRISV